MLLTSCSSIPFMAWRRPSYVSARHSSPPTTNTSTKVVQSSHFNNNSSPPRYFQYRDNRSMTFNYMVYMLYTRKGYFSFLLGAMPRESFHLTEMHKLSRKRRRFTCFIVSSSIRSGVASKMTLRSIRDLEVICPHLVLLHANLYRPRVNGSRVT